MLVNYKRYYKGAEAFGVIIKGARWFDSERMEFIAGRDIRIEDDVIVQIGKCLERSGEEIFELSGMLVLPGWIDSHVHLTLSGEVDVIGTWKKDGVLISAIKAAVKYLQEYLRAGIIAVRDVGGDGDIALQLKKIVLDGVVDGPDIYAAGHALTMTGGHIYQISQEIDGCNEARKAARQQLKKGVDLLKVIATGGILTAGVQPGAPQLSIEEMQVIVDEAHKAGRKVAAHAEGKEGVLNSLKAGVDTLEHGVGLDEEGIALLKRNSGILVPTLAAPKLILEHRNELPEEMVEKAEIIIDEHRKSVKLAYARGCRIAIGTDAGTPFNHHGRYYREIEELLEAGMKVEEVLQAASLNGAYALGIEKLMGNIAEGKKANLTVIEERLDESDWFRYVRMVWKNGKVAFSHI